MIIIAVVAWAAGKTFSSIISDNQRKIALGAIISVIGAIALIYGFVSVGSMTIVSQADVAAARGIMTAGAFALVLGLTVLVSKGWKRLK